ncbi:hypothetical protein Pcac1_g7444 [Phytophthora cactorum]|uniref:Uncharacterized protein n=1 Tax=Phytophthora cactorum TaxID=29920 RepID=A0A329RFH5_9STRA|nr:hypothetical protein GQ600_11890 [Phytophthora cactorum]KAG2783146.1 hypothetical protein Pcac1_g7444 [Phytophthora cactorum]RAW22809.1 hypothetical protein PC110_g20754 [Phytophthora cactorum]
MGCAGTACQEGNELKTDPRTVCTPIHHMCAIGGFEGKDSSLNERYCCLACARKVYPTEGPVTDAKGGTNTPTSASMTSKRPSSNIWTGSDSDFVLSSESPEEESCGPVQRGCKADKAFCFVRTRRC